MEISDIKDFVVFDFETATHDRQICQVGITVVKDRTITESTSALIQPPGNKYDDGCIRVHGITPDKTKDEPTFDQYYKHTKAIMENYVIVMHNADFDLSALERTCQFYGLDPIKPLQVICTYRLYGHSLADLCAGFGIDCSGHHDAEFDTRCTAQFFINWLNGVEPDESKYGVKEDFFARSGHATLKGDILKKDLTGADPDGLFYDKKVVITGVFPMDRKELARRLKACGADIDTCVTVRTDYILTGDEPGPAKIKKYEKIKSEGGKIKRLLWDDFKNDI